MKTVICCLNSKYIHSSLAPWCLLAGVRAYCSAEVTAKVVEGTVNEPQDAIFDQLSWMLLVSGLIMLVLGGTIG